MKILMVGFGSIARRHIKNIKVIKPNAKIAVWEQYDTTAALGAMTPFIEKLVFSAEDAFAWNAKVVFVVNPTTLHCDTAFFFAKCGAHLFIEKPLSHCKDGIDDLIHLARRNNLVVMVGYVLRFTRQLQMLKTALNKNSVGRPLSFRATIGQHLSLWRPDQRYQDTVTAQKNLGGGVLLELSHEIDYMQWLGGAVTQVYALTGKVSDLDIDVEDVAEILLQFASGAVGHIHLDMLDYSAHRSCRIVGERGTLAWNRKGDNHVELFSKDQKCWTPLLCEDGTQDRNSMYLDELHHFFDCIEKNRDPLISLHEGRQVVEIISSIQTSVQQGKVVLL